MPSLPITASALGILLGLFATACTLVLLVACAPNSTPRLSRMLARCAKLVLAAGAAAFIGGFWVAASGHWWTGAAIGASPVLVGAVVIGVLSRFDA